jgi:dienelactone hydrolase
MFIRCLTILSLAAAASIGHAGTTQRLADYVCTQPDVIYRARFEAAEAATPHIPSNGSGGALTANPTRIVSVSDYGEHTYYLHVPNGYSPARSWPVVVVLHGASSLVPADQAAQIMRNDWAAVADANGFIVAAPAGSGDGGGWIAPAFPGDHPSDYEVIAAALADVESAYNVERTRRYVWGFSAGGYILYDLIFNNLNSAISFDTISAISISGAAMYNLACNNDLAVCDQIVAQAPRHIPLSIHIGNGDSRYTLARADYDRFLANGWIEDDTARFILYVGGHDYAGSEGNIWHALCPYALIP